MTAYHQRRAAEKSRQNAAHNAAIDEFEWREQQSEVLTVRVKSETDPTLEYTLHVQGETIVCNCRGYNSHGHCKHQTALRRVLAEESHRGNG